MKAVRKLLVGALAGAFALALSASVTTRPPEMGPDANKPNYNFTGGPPPLNDAQMAAARAKAAAAAKELRSKRGATPAPAPAPPTDPTTK